RIAPSIGVDQSFQGLDQLGVMMDQRLSSGPRMPDSLNGEGALRKALDGPIDGRARKTSNTGDDGNTSSSQSLAIEGCNQVLLSLIEVRKQQGVLPLKFFGFAHSRIIPSPPSFVTLNFLRALTPRTAMEGSLVNPETGLLPQVEVPDRLGACFELDVGDVVVATFFTTASCGQGPPHLQAMAVLIPLVTGDFHLGSKVDIDGDPSHGPSVIRDVS